MRGNRVLRIIRIALFVAAAVALMGFVVMHLWNWLMPAIFGLRTIGFGQALGLLLLSKLLLGGLRRGGWRGWGGPGMFWRRRMIERWEKMTPEEREKFRMGMRGRCGPFGAGAGMAEQKE
jgi:hypothetical protein